MSDPHDIFGPVIHTYTRAEAIADGVLVEVPEALRAEAGYGVSVALTRAAWDDAVAWDETDTKAPCQSETGRLWDVLWMARTGTRKGGDRASFQLYRVPRNGPSTEPELITLVIHIGPGDHAEPVITITTPTED